MQKQNIGDDICCSHILKRKDAEAVITFTKAGNLLFPGSIFTKKIYLKQNGEFIAETICYHTKVYIGKSEKLLKLLHITFESNKNISKVENSILSSIPKRHCSEFIKKYLCNSISVKRTGSLRNDIFMISSMSFQLYDITPDKHEEKKRWKLPTITSLNEEANLGKLAIEFTSNTRFTKCNFVVEIEIIRKTKINVKESIKQRLVNCLHECSVDIQTCCSCIPKIITLKSKAETFRESMEYLLSMDLFNWKTLGFQFVTPKHESFYKQIRRKNKCLPRV